MTDMEIFTMVIVASIAVSMFAWFVSMAWRGRKRPDISEAAELAEMLKRSVKA